MLDPGLQQRTGSPTQSSAWCLKNPLGTRCVAPLVTVAVTETSVLSTQPSGQIQEVGDGRETGPQVPLPRSSVLSGLSASWEGICAFSVAGSNLY